MKVCMIGGRKLKKEQQQKGLGSAPEKASQMKRFTDWNTVVPINHGYDETKPESELTLTDMQGAAEFRGGLTEWENSDKIST